MTEAFPFLNPINQLPGIRAAWVERLPQVDVDCDRDAAMTRLRGHHEAAVLKFAPQADHWWRAEQVHGNAVAVVPGPSESIAPDGLPVVPAVDGLVTATTNQVLGIYVADCGAIWLADRRTGAIGLLHSGRKGTEQNILAQAIDHMRESFGSRPQDITAVLSPCIRPPDYDVDFAAEIHEQARQAAIGAFIDSNLNTAADPQRFYSYRKEQGKTGRMLALLIRDPQVG